MKTLASALHKAIHRREKLPLKTNAMRLVNGAGDALDGLIIDRYNKHFQIQVLKEQWQKHIDEICDALSSALPVEYLIVKYRDALHHGGCRAEPSMKGNAGTTIEENGIKFDVHLNDGLNCGLFLDMRYNRRIVGEFSKDKKVLNCFSYTCSFGVYTRVGGAREVINTDISRKILERGHKNYELNALATGPGEFIKADSVAYLQRAFKKGNTFDVIIIDPPSFARHEGNVFQVKRDLPKLMALAVAVLNPGGAMLVTTNYSGITHAELERFLSKGLNGRRVASVQRVGQDVDFIGSNSIKESYLAGLWVKFL